MAQCPTCRRPILTIHSKKCLYCGATIPAEILARIQPPDMKRIEGMLLLRRMQDGREVRRSYLLARWIYGSGALVSLAGMFLILYQVFIRAVFPSVVLGLAISSFLFVFGLFMTYKAFRPQPMTTRRHRV